MLHVFVLRVDKITSGNWDFPENFPQLSNVRKLMGLDNCVINYSYDFGVMLI